MKLIINRNTWFCLKRQKKCVPVHIPGILLETSSLSTYVENDRMIGAIIVTLGIRWPFTTNVLQKLEIFLATEA